MKYLKLFEGWMPEYEVGDYVLVNKNSWGSDFGKAHFKEDQPMRVKKINLRDKEYVLDFVLLHPNSSMYGDIFEEDEIIRKLKDYEVEAIKYNL